MPNYARELDILDLLSVGDLVESLIAVTHYHMNTKLKIVKVFD